MRCHSSWEGLNLQVDARNLIAAFQVMISCALAKFSEAHMAVLAQFDPGCNQNAVDINAGMTLKLKQQVHYALISRASAQDPTTAPEYGAGQSPHQARRVHDRHGFHFESPRDGSRFRGIIRRHVEPHFRIIGK